MQSAIMCGVRHLYKTLNHPTDTLDSFEVSLMLRSLKVTMTHIRRSHDTVTVYIVNKLIQHYTPLGQKGIILKTAILFIFWGLLRINNLAHATLTSFDPRRHTCRGDILLQYPGIVIILKWSKTCQDHKSVNLIPIPRIPGHPMCHVQAYITMTEQYKTKHNNTPLLIQDPLGCNHQFVGSSSWTAFKTCRFI